jgi:hypothetical protein
MPGCRRSPGVDVVVSAPEPHGACASSSGTIKMRARRTGLSMHLTGRGRTRARRQLRIAPDIPRFQLGELAAGSGCPAAVNMLRGPTAEVPVSPACRARNLADPPAMMDALRRRTMAACSAVNGPSAMPTVPWDTERIERVEQPQRRFPSSAVLAGGLRVLRTAARCPGASPCGFQVLVDRPYAKPAQRPGQMSGKGIVVTRSLTAGLFLALAYPGVRASHSLKR